MWPKFDISLDLLSMFTCVDLLSMFTCVDLLPLFSCVNLHSLFTCVHFQGVTDPQLDPRFHGFVFRELFEPTTTLEWHHCLIHCHMLMWHIFILKVPTYTVHKFPVLLLTNERYQWI